MTTCRFVFTLLPILAAFLMTPIEAPEPEGEIQSHSLTTIFFLEDESYFLSRLTLHSTDTVETLRERLKSNDAVRRQVGQDAKVQIPQKLGLFNNMLAKNDYELLFHSEKNNRMAARHSTPLKEPEDNLLQKLNEHLLHCGFEQPEEILNSPDGISSIAVKLMVKASSVTVEQCTNRIAEFDSEMRALGHT